MASACVTNIKIEPYTWHRTPVDPPPAPDLSPDFEFFRLDDPTVTMLPADELFSDGKLKPISTVRSSSSTTTSPSPKPDTPTKSRLSQPDPFFSPRAPTCSIRWKNILKLKKLNKSSAIFQTSPPNPKPNTIGPSSRSLLRSLKHDSSDTDSSVSTSSRLSLSSSSSSSQDEKPNRPRGNALVESPRLNSNGKVVFERSTSSPGSFNNNNNNRNNNKNNNNNGVRMIERSYSAHVVRVAPVLNVVPVKFGFFSASSSKRDNLGNGGGRVRGKSSRSGNRTEQA